MIKVKVTNQFTLGAFKELKNIVRANPQKDKENYLFVGDTFECTDKMAKYLGGENQQNKSFVEVIEIIPEKEIQDATQKAVDEATPKNKKTRKKKIEE